MIRCWLEKLHVVKPKGAAVPVPSPRPRPHRHIHHHGTIAKWKITCVATGLAIPGFAIPYYAGGGRLGDFFSPLPSSSVAVGNNPEPSVPIYNLPGAIDTILREQALNMPVHIATDNMPMPEATDNMHREQAVPEPATIILLLTFIFILAVFKKLLDIRRVHIHTSQR